MNEKQFYGFTGKGNGKEERYARIFRTKIGNEYLILMEEDRIHYHCVPLEDLKRFCEAYPLSDNDACQAHGFNRGLKHAEIEPENFNFQEAHDFSRGAAT